MGCREALRICSLGRNDKLRNVTIRSVSSNLDETVPIGKSWVTLAW